ncbi:MAG: isoprenylcysteine carboxylmethyltransferase family protein [Thermodesulfobacteriota bacterium]
MASTKQFVPKLVMALSVLLGGGSLLLFALFLVIGPVSLVSLGVSEQGILLSNAFLSGLFFLQHSVMVRLPFQTWLASVVERHYHPSIYAIASGIVLSAVVLLWQPSQTVVFHAEGLLRMAARAVSALAVIGFIWGARSLGSFDSFGLIALKVHLCGRQLRPPEFVLRGPYRWVRHPLYFFVILLIWSNPDLTVDRLLFNILWTLWIVVGTLLEERDLLAAFGERYRRYQKTVPMLIPWRFLPFWRGHN